MANDSQTTQPAMAEGVFVDTGVREPVTLINAFTLPTGESDRFLDRWRDNARVMASQPGFIRARMFSALNDDAELLQINVTEWDSGTALDNARKNPEWLAARQRVIDDPHLHVTARPEVYRVDIDVRPGDTL